jgi:hypothetical protein
VFFAVGEREEDEEDGGGERELEIVWYIGYRYINR